MAEEPSQPPLKRAKKWAHEHPRAKWGVVAGLAAALAVAFLLWLHFRQFVSTDDAQIDGWVSSLSTRVAGTVTAVYVDDNQYVHAGDVLVELDPSDYRVAVDQAEANLAQARAQVRAQVPSVPITTTTNETSLATLGATVTSATADLAAAERDVDSARARLIQTEAQDRLAQVDYLRSSALVVRGAVSKADLDQHTASADSAEAALRADRAALDAASKRVEERKEALAQARARLDEARANTPRQLDVQRSTVEAREAAVQAALAALDQARLNLGYTRIVAPVNGIVGRRSANVGNRVEPGQQLMVIVQVDNLWVTANFKETQIERMRPGEHARVSVDAYGRTLQASVESLGGASGSRFSLFPPENATGNYVKVVQRMPVRLTLDPHAPDYGLLRPGMSVEARVYVR